ncbi:T9SS type A sorting domain-containing protein [Ekhidna sp.]
MTQTLVYKFLIFTFLVAVLSYISFAQSTSLTYGNTGNLSQGASFEADIPVSSRQADINDVTFSTDGLSVFIIGSDGGGLNAKVNQYSLSSPFNLASSSSYLGDYTISGQETNPKGIAFSDDGLQMFIVGSSDQVNVYDLSTPFSIASGVVHASSQTVVSNLTSMAFGEDGAKLFVIRNSTNKEVYQYDLSTPYDISTISLDGTFNVQNEASNPQGIAFNATGTQMFIVGQSSKSIYQYSLSSPFNLTSGASYDGVLLNIAAQERFPNGITFSADGSRFYITESQNQDINQYAIPADQFREGSNNDGSVDGFLTIQLAGDAFTSAGGTLSHGTDYTVNNSPGGLTPSLDVDASGTIATLTFTGNATDHQDINDVSELAITFTNAAFVGADASSVSGVNDPTGVGIDFRDNTPSIFYGNGFDPTQAKYLDEAIDVSSIDSQPLQMRLSTDGTKFYLLGGATKAIHQFTLSAPYQIDNSMTSDGAPYDLTGLSTNIFGFNFNNDGSKIYLLDNTTDAVYQYTLTTPFDVTGTVTLDGSYTVAEDGFPLSITFDASGNKMFITGTSADQISQYSLSTPFDVLSTVNFEGALSVASEETNPGRIEFAKGGTQLLLIGSRGDDITQYNLSAPFDITLDIAVSSTFYIGREDWSPSDFVFNADGSKMFMLGSGYDKVYEYDVDKGGYSENSANDGGLTGTIDIYLFDEVFNNAGGTLSTANYSVGNLPAGLSTELSVDANGIVASLSIDGQANDHQNIHDVSNLILTFSDGAFLGGDASEVMDATAFDTGIGIDFRDNNPALFYGNPLALNQTTYSGNSVSIGGQESSYATGIALNADGTRIFMAGGDESQIFEYSLSIPYDLASTFSYTGNSLDLSVNADSPEDLAFSPDGMRLFITSIDMYEIVQYNLSSAFDLSTATYSGNSYNVSSIDQSVYGLAFSYDGSKMFLVGEDGNNIYQFSLPTPFDLSSVVLEFTYYVGNEVYPSGISISRDGRHIIVVGSSDMVSYTLNTPFDLADGATYNGVDFDFSGQDTYGTGIATSSEGDKIFVLGSDNFIISQYDVSVGGFNEVVANDGQLEGSLTIHVVDDPFSNAGGSFVYNTDYSIGNLPSGLTPTLTVDADGYSAVLTIAGTADLHGDLQDVDGLVFTFSNSAFSNYTANNVQSAIDNNSGVGIDFSPYTESDITSFTFDGIDGDAVIDAAETAVDAVALAGTNIAALTPTVTVSPGATVSPNTGVVQDFTNSLVYTVTAEDGTITEWDVVVTEAIATPTDILLSSTSVDEGSDAGTVVGSLSALDENFNEGFTFYVVAVLEDDDWRSFAISENNLVTTDFIALDFETKNTFTFDISVQDQDGEIFEKEFTITLNDVNEDPTDVSLDNAAIDESNPLETVVGALSTIDEDEGQMHSYTLVSGDGDTDNASFAISGGNLVSAEIFDFETKDSYSVRIQTSDGNGGTYEEAFSIAINDLVSQISSLTLSNEDIDENESTGTSVGSFTTFGEDLSGSYTYSLVSGTGDTDNSSFTISDNELLTSESFDFETKNSLSIRVKTDDGSLEREEVFTISVNNVFEAPTGIELSTSTIEENNSAGDLIGSLTTIDEDEGETYTYAIATGTGDTDNASFTISGDQLIAQDVFDFETQSSYSVRVETNDGNGGTYQEVFTISVTNENESITVLNPIADQSYNEGFATSDIDLADVFVDMDGDELSFTAISGDNSVVTIGVSGTALTVTEVGIGTSNVSVTADDSNGLSVTTTFTITVTETPLGLEDDLSLSIYPNPVSNILNVESSKAFEVRLTDVNGKIMDKGQGKSIRMNIETLSEGVYLILIDQEGQTIKRRIIKAN